MSPCPCPPGADPALAAPPHPPHPKPKRQRFKAGGLRDGTRKPVPLDQQPEQTRAMEALVSALIAEVHAAGTLKATRKASKLWCCQQRRLEGYRGILPGGSACGSVSCPFCVGAVLRAEWAKALTKLAGANPKHCYSITFRIGVAGTAWDAPPLIEMTRKKVRAVARRVRRAGGGIEVYGLTEGLSLPAGEWRGPFGFLPHRGKGEMWELMLHAHLAVYLPGRTLEEALALFQHEFPGDPGRVHATPLTPGQTVGENVAGISAYALKALRPLHHDPAARLPLSAEVVARSLYCLPRGLEAVRIEIEPPRPKRVHSNPPCRSDVTRAGARAGRGRRGSAAADVPAEGQAMPTDAAA